MRNKGSLRLLWDTVPVLTRNLVEEGLVDSKFNAALTRAAVTSFNEYTRTPTTSASAAWTNHSEAPDEAAGASGRTKLRRVRHTRSLKGLAFQSSSSLGSQLASSSSEPHPSTNDGGTCSGVTPNDRFFEHQRMRGYRLATPSIASCPEVNRLQEELIVDTVVDYLWAIGGGGNDNRGDSDESSARLPPSPLHSNIIDRLRLGTGEFAVDLWATVQRGKMAYHKDHVHEDVLVSGVYYAAVPPGSAPLVLRCPSSTNKNVTAPKDKQEDQNTTVLPPKEGQLVIFPPWLWHGVPPRAEAMAAANALADSNSPPTRVSYAFNISGAYTWGDPWDVTRVDESTAARLPLTHEVGK